MEISGFLRSRRLSAGLKSYEAVVKKARAQGFNISVQALNKAERQNSYLVPKTREMYIELYSLCDTDVATLDLLSCNQLIKKGSNTNPHLRVINTKEVLDNIEDCATLLSDLIEEKALSISEQEKEVIREYIKGKLWTAVIRGSG